jgi:hypothetical protein
MSGSTDQDPVPGPLTERLVQENGNSLIVIMFDRVVAPMVPNPVHAVFPICFQKKLRQIFNNKIKNGKRKKLFSKKNFNALFLPSASQQYRRPPAPQ